MFFCCLPFSLNVPLSRLRNQVPMFCGLFPLRENEENDAALLPSEKGWGLPCGSPRGPAGAAASMEGGSQMGVGSSQSPS